MIKTGEISEDNTPPDESDETLDKKASPKDLEEHPSRRLERSISQQRRPQQDAGRKE